MKCFHSHSCSRFFSSYIQKSGGGGGGVDEGIVAINDAVDVHHTINCRDEEIRKNVSG